MSSILTYKDTGVASAVELLRTEDLIVTLLVLPVAVDVKYAKVAPTNEASKIITSKIINKIIFLF